MGVSRGMMIRLVMLGLVGLVGPGGPVNGAVLYTVLGLGNLGGTPGSSTGFAINSTGQVGGISSTATSGSEHGFLAADGVLTDLGTLGGLTSSANGISDSGVLVGGSKLPSGSQHAFRYSGGVMSDLGTLGGLTSTAFSINSDGVVVGGSATALAGTTHAFRYAGGVLTDLGTLGGTSSIAYGINASGTIVGKSNPSGSTNTHAALFFNGGWTDLGTLGGSSSVAWGVNASGQVVGQSNLTGNTVAHAFLYTGGAMSDLGALGGPTKASLAYAVNDRGQVVGYAETTTAGEFHAFSYVDGVMTDLNTVITPIPGVTLGVAYAVNANGQIVADGYLLTPLPSFGAAANVALSSVQTSNTVTLTGIGQGANIAVTGGEYSVGCTALFTNGAGIVNSGQTVCLRQTASNLFTTTTKTTLTLGLPLGAVNLVFSATTLTADLTPNPFTFNPVAGVALNSVQTSNTVTISGINSPAPISVVGGEYSIGCAPAFFTSAVGTITNGQTVCVRQTASSASATLTNATLTVGGVIGTFSATTLADPTVEDSGGGGGALDWFSLGILGLLAAGQRLSRQGAGFLSDRPGQ